jgi:hypothetical protein
MELQEGKMANADGKHFGKGVKGKGDGGGAMTDIPADLPENAVLSNRDKKQHPEERGLDSKHVETEQRQDHAANRQPELRKKSRDPGRA